MANSLSIRSYSRQRKGHAHDYHQLVLPLRGVINIALDSFTGKVKPGECVVVKAGIMHHFDADAQAKFVVADLDRLPVLLAESDTLVFSVSSPLFHFLAFVEQQLNHQINTGIEALMLETFGQLLAQQRLLRKAEPRINNALEYMEDNLAETLSIERLAAVANLSPTQFKKLFKQQTGETATQYLTRLRMEKAQALLLHTDYPVQIVAELVGYTDLTAFSRRFSRYFGMPPSRLTR